MIQEKLIRKQRTIILFFVITIILTIIIGLNFENSSLFNIILGHRNERDKFIFLNVRLPRIILTLISGMALALSGLILQIITKNNLADPGIIGINSGAGVAIAILILYFEKITLASSIVPMVGLIGALLTSLIIFGISYNKYMGFQPLNLILVGVGVSMAFSGLMIIIVSSADRIKVEFILKWLSGSIWGADWQYIFAILPWFIGLIIYIITKANNLNILMLNEEVSIGLGIDVTKERLKLLIISVALSATIASIVGGISFVGLMAPHIAKTLVGARNQLTIPVAILCGGWLLLLSDIVGRLIFQPNVIPAGIMVSIFGAPYFIYLLMKEN